MNYKIFPTINYRIKKKPVLIKKDFKIKYKIQRLKYKYLKKGTIKSASIVMLVLKNRHPCLLTLKVSYKNFFLFHCNNLLPNKNPLQYIRAKVNFFYTTNEEKLEYKIKLFTLLGVFIRKNFESSFFPYLLPHVNNVKELRYLILFQLPNKMIIGVNIMFKKIPKNLKFFAIPFLEIHKNKRYGSIIPFLPILISIYLLKKKTRHNLKKK